MAHHQQQQADGSTRTSTMQSLLKMLNPFNTPTVPLGDDELNGEPDEPPDDEISPLRSVFSRDDTIYIKSRPAAGERRESMLTRALLASTSDEHETPHIPVRGLSTVSSNSTASMTSTAELTSDGNLTSPPQSTTPSPSFPATHYQLPITKGDMLPPSKVKIASQTQDERPIVADVGEAAIEKTLGRKRCIMFACGNKEPEKPKVVAPEPKKEEIALPKRKCMISFACPSRVFSDKTSEARKEETIAAPRRMSPLRTRISTDVSPAVGEEKLVVKSATDTPLSPMPKQTFHEFATSTDEPDTWVDQPTEYKRKLTLNDCMKKENAIRQLGQEAEEEAEDEEEAEKELDNEVEDEATAEDDFAPSDESSDAGNESDDEGGFADSDEESDAGSEYLFWAPSTTTAATSTDNINISHFSSRQRSTASSPESTPPTSHWAAHAARRTPSRQRASKIARMRPATPELPDSTDFVCGTLDEDRPLEQAYISCREQRKREKHVPIPQDIDPSFPTTDPDDNEDDDVEDDEETDDHLWLKDQLNGFEEDNGRGRRKSSTVKGTPILSPPSQTRLARPTAIRPGVGFGRSPAPKHIAHRSPPPKARVARSPAPKPRMGRSPPPNRPLFGHLPSHLRSPAPARRLNSPRGSPEIRQMTTVGLNVQRLGQRPNMGRTSSLPRTPNPFFHNYDSKAQTSTVTSGPVSPGGGSDIPPPSDMHIRGPIDIMTGIEKKRQKRKEKFWRQHCRKAAKEQAERKPVPGRGAERMMQLGLECAERARGYGINQPAQVVISL
jgi:hypothetical protein